MTDTEATSPSALSRLKEMLGDSEGSTDASQGSDVPPTSLPNKAGPQRAPRAQGRFGESQLLAGDARVLLSAEASGRGNGDAIESLATNTAAFVKSDAPTGEASMFAPGGDLDFSAFPLEPIPLIVPKTELSAGGASKEFLEVNPAALALLRSIKVPVSVLAVCGLYRTGKSSLLNWLCDPDVNKAFDLDAPTADATTGAATDDEGVQATTTATPTTAEGAEGAGAQSPGGGGDGNNGGGNGKSAGGPASGGGSSGFAVGATVQRCTRGIWLWGRPRAVRLASPPSSSGVSHGGNEDAPKYGALLVLDTEGLGGLESGAQYDARIFALATLLCSTLCYNSLGTIDEKAIASLSFVAQLAKNIRLTSSQPPSPSSQQPSSPSPSSSSPHRALSPSPESANDNGHAGSSSSSSSGSGSGDEQGVAAAAAAGELRRFFPSFVWVVRDFALDLRDEDGEAITPDEYLDTALRPQPGFDSSTVERNGIRRAITTFFHQRKTVTLVRPLHDEAKLQQVDLVPWRELRPEFRRDFEGLQSTLFSAPRAKTLGAVNGGGGSGGGERELTGDMYATLVEAYVSAVNDEGGSGLPVIGTAWDAVAASECDAAAEAGAEAYLPLFERFFFAASPSTPTRKKLPWPESEAAFAHASAYSATLASFEGRAEGAKAAAAKAKLEASLRGQFESWLSRNREASQGKCAKVLATLYGRSPLARLEALDSDGSALTHLTAGGGAGGDGSRDSSGVVVTLLPEGVERAGQSARQTPAHPLADASTGPALLSEALADFVNAYRTGAALPSQHVEEGAVLASSSSLSSDGEAQPGSSGGGGGGGGGGTAVVFEEDGSNDDDLNQGDWWANLGPCAESELAVFLGLKWPLLLRRACGAVELAKDKAAGALAVELAEARTNEVKAAVANESRVGEVGAKDSEVMALKVQVAKLSAVSEGAQKRQAEVEVALRGAAKAKAKLELEAEEAKEECLKLGGDLSRAKEELQQSEEEKVHLQDRLDAIPPFDPKAANKGCCAVM